MTTLNTSTPPMDVPGDQTPWLVVLTVFLVLLVLALVGTCFCIYLLYLKLWQHEKEIRQNERDIQSLQEALCSQKHVVLSKQDSTHPDSAVEVNVDELEDTVEMRRSGEENQSVVGIKPRSTIKIKREQANVFGHQLSASQMVALAQTYYKEETKSDVSVPADKISIDQYDRRGRKTVFSSILDEDIFSGKLTSVLIDMSDPTVQRQLYSHNKGVFAHKTVGKSGGQFTVSGINLRVPKDALDSPVVITVGVIWDEKIQPKLSKRQARLSPIVLCQPSGLQFKLPPELTFPHCAVDLKNWNTTVLKREGALNDAAEWSILTEGDTANQNVTSDWVHIKVPHFTLYTLVGESKEDSMAAKAVKMVAFSPGLRNKELFTTRIYCVNDYREYQEIKSIEKDDLGGKAVGARVPLFINDNGENVKTKLTHLSDEWKNNGEDIEELPFETVWHAQSPSCTFSFRSVKRLSPKSITCDFSSYQIDGKDKAILKIAETMVQTISPLSSFEDDSEVKLHIQLILLLDPKRVVGSDAGDWRDLADKMGYNKQQITWLESQTNPTEKLMDKWREDGRSYQDLLQLMEQINRPDAATEINKLLPFIEPSSA